MSFAVCKHRVFYEGCRIIGKYREIFIFDCCLRIADFNLQDSITAKERGGFIGENDMRRSLVDYHYFSIA